MKSESGSLGALSVGVRLKLARDMRGLTMTEVVDEAGIAASTVNVIEKGQKQPRGDTVERLARALGVSRCWLAYGDGPVPDWTQGIAGLTRPDAPASPLGADDVDLRQKVAELASEVRALRAIVERSS